MAKIGAARGSSAASGGGGGGRGGGGSGSGGGWSGILRYILRVDSREGVRAAKQLNLVFSALNSTTFRVAAGMLTLGTVLLLFGKRAISAARTFQEAWAEVSTIFLDSGRAAKVAQDQILSLSKSMSTQMQSPAELARGYYQVLSSGFQEAGDALRILTVASKTAEAGLTDTFTSVDAITTVLNAYGLGAEHASHVSDLMFTTVREGKVVFKELADSIGFAVPFFATAGIKMEDMFAAIATLTKGGLRAHVAMTALRGVISQVLKPTDEAVKLANMLGIEFTTEAIATKGLARWMADLADKTKNNQALVSKLFPDVRGLTGVLNLYGKQLGEVTRQSEIMNDVWGATDAAFIKVQDTWDRQYQLLKNRLNPTLVGVGNKLLSIPTLFVKGINYATENSVTKMARIKGEFVDAARVTGKLLDDYKELEKVDLSKLSVEEQAKHAERLATAVEKILDVVPGAYQSDIANQLGINVDMVEELGQAAVETLFTEFTIALAEKKNELQDAENDLRKVRESFERMDALRKAGGQNLTDVLFGVGDDFATIIWSETEAVHLMQELNAKIRILRQGVRDGEADFHRMADVVWGTSGSVGANLENVIRLAEDWNSILKEIAVKRAEDVSTREQKGFMSQMDYFRKKIVEYARSKGYDSTDARFVLPNDATAWETWKESNKQIFEDLDAMYREDRDAYAKAQEEKRMSAEDAAKAAARAWIEKLEALTKNYFVSGTSAMFGPGFAPPTTRPGRFESPDDRWLKSVDAALENLKWELGGVSGAMERAVRSVLDGSISVIDVVRNMDDETASAFLELVDSVREGSDVDPAELKRAKDIVEARKNMSDEEKKAAKNTDNLVQAVRRARIEIAGFDLGGIFADFIDDARSGTLSRAIGNSVNTVMIEGASFFINKMIEGIGSMFAKDRSGDRLRAAREAARGLEDAFGELPIAYVDKLASKFEDLWTWIGNLGRDAFDPYAIGETLKQIYEWTDEMASMYDADFLRVPDEIRGDWNATMEFLASAWRQLQDLIRNEGIFSEHNMAGVIQKWQFLVDMMDIEDPLEKWARLKDILNESSDYSLNWFSAFMGWMDNAKLSADEMNRATGLLGQIFAGVGGGINAENPLVAQLAELLGFNTEQLLVWLNQFLSSTTMTPDQIAELIATIENLGDDILGQARELSDTQVGVTRSVDITRQQGDAIVAALNSILYLMRSVADTLSALYSAAQQALVAPAVAGAGVGGVTVNGLSIYVTATGDPQETGAAVARGFVREINRVSSSSRSRYGIKIGG